MELKMCCAFVVTLVLTILCNINAVPLADVTKFENDTKSVIPLGEIDIDDESAENKTTNGTQKDL